jgi:tRNA A-37 threonylcarbamoyl transferase component Bud32
LEKSFTKINGYGIIILGLEAYMNLIATGATADVFLNDNNRLVKLFKDNFSKEHIENEANNQKIIYAMGIPVPEIYEIIKIDERYGIVMEYIKGISLGERILGNNDYINGINIGNDIVEKIENIKHYLDIIIDLQIKVNSIKLKEYPLMKEKLTQQINASRYINKRQKDIFLDKLKKIKFGNYLCHGDFHPFNLIETEHGIKIIDWADSTMGDIEADVCRSYFLYWVIYPEMANEYLKLYCKKTKTDKGNILIYEPIIAAARLSENIAEEECSKIIKLLEKYM